MALHIMDEANRCLQCKVPQCQKGCPIHTNIPLAIRLLKENKLNEAGKMLFENNPLTTVCSLVCNHENQCEGHCVLGRKGAPVHFSSIENYISTTYANQMTNGPAKSNGMRVAISVPVLPVLRLRLFLHDTAIRLLFLKERTRLAVYYATASRNSVCQRAS